MGYELDKIMQQYGVLSPSIGAYPTNATATNAKAPVAPVAPVVPATTTGTGSRTSFLARGPVFNPLSFLSPAVSGNQNYFSNWKSGHGIPNTYASDKAAYDIAKAAYDQKLADYNAQQGVVNPTNKSLYDQYKAAYENRITSTPMYNQQQYGVANPVNPSPLALPKYSAARGGSIRDLVRKYDDGGSVDLANKYLLEDRLDTSPAYYDPAAIPDEPIPNATGDELPIEETAYIPPDTVRVVAAPVVAKNATTAPVNPSRMPDLQALVDRYAELKGTEPSPVAAARQRARAEQDAFTQILGEAMTNPERSKASKAEMYFRLAAAFGSPTKTGAFGENLALASKEMAEQQKGQQEAMSETLKQRILAQKIKSDYSQAELKAAIAEETARQKGTLPLSTAGKMASDAGLIPGSKEYKAFVNKQADITIAQKNAAIGSAESGIEKNTREAERLSNEEIRLKDKTKIDLDNLTQAEDDLKRAYEYSPKAYVDTPADKAARFRDENFLAETAGKPTGRLYATREMENRLQSQTLKSLRSTFGAQFTEKEGQKLEEISGIKAKNSEERDRIILENLKTVRRLKKQKEQDLQNIMSGKYGLKTKEGA
jgi:hypothetical protein